VRILLVLDNANAPGGGAEVAFDLANQFKAFRFVELAQEINASMPAFVIQRAQEMLNDQGKSLNGANILILGVSYKPNIADTRESTAIPLIHGLMKRGARVSFDDPYVWSLEVAGADFTCVPDRIQSISRADLFVVLQAHGEYQALCQSIDSAGVLDTRRSRSGNWPMFPSPLGSREARWAHA